MAAGGRAEFVATDVTDEAAVQAAVDAASALAPLRVVVNCAGVGTPGKVVGKKGPLPLAAFHQVVTINLVGTFNVIRLAAAAMMQTEPVDGERGVVVNTASAAAFDGQIGQAAYAASKGGVVGMTLPIARELASSLIRVMTIAPGLFETPMLAGLPQEAQDSLGAQVPHPLAPRPPGRVRRAGAPHHREPDAQRRGDPPRRRDPDGAALSAPTTPRHQELFDALVALFLAEGFARSTLDDLAARLRCSKSTLYQLARSKDELVRAVAVHFFREATAGSRRRVDEHGHVVRAAAGVPAGHRGRAAPGLRRLLRRRRLVRPGRRGVPPQHRGRGRPGGRAAGGGRAHRRVPRGAGGVRDRPGERADGADPAGRGAARPPGSTTPTPTRRWPTWCCTGWRPGADGRRWGVVRFPGATPAPRERGHRAGAPCAPARARARPRRARPVGLAGRHRTDCVDGPRRAFRCGGGWSSSVPAPGTRGRVGAGVGLVRRVVVDRRRARCRGRCTESSGSRWRAPSTCCHRRHPGGVPRLRRCRARCSARAVGDEG